MLGTLLRDYDIYNFIEGMLSGGYIIIIIINPRRACAAKVMVLGLCVCVCHSTSHFSRVYSCHK